MTEKELAIYEGLLILAPETAAFFKTGIEIFKIDIDARAYMLAHLSREIEGGLRDILYVKENSIKCPNCGKSMTENRCLKCNSKIEDGVCSVCKTISKLEKCPSCSHPIDSEHLKSILKALGINEKNDLAKKWHSTAKKFHKYAHRHGAEKKPRDKNAFDKLWIDFVEILGELVGNYFSISERVDAIISYKKPSKQIIDSLPNLFIKESIIVYFFKNLRQLYWLNPLYEKGYFSGDKNPSPIEVEIKDGTKGLSFPRWVILDYLLFCANETKNTDEDFSTILKIIDDIALYRNPDGAKILNPHTDDTIIRLISQLPNDKIEEKHFDYINNAIRNPYSFSTLAFESLINRFIKEVDKRNLLRCLDILFSFTRVENQIERYYPIIEISFLIHFRERHGKDIINICGLEGIEIILEKLSDVSQDERFFDVHTIEDHPQNWDQYKYVLQLVFFARDYLLFCPIEYLIEKINSFVSHENEIYHRLAFYLINVRYDELQGLFWSLKTNPLDNLINKHELFELIKNHHKELEKNEQAKILEWIESISYKSFIDEKDYDQILWHSKKEWLLALEGVGNEDIQAAKEKYSELYPHSIEHPGFSSWMSSQVGFESPVYLEEIEKRNLLEVITLFSEYEKKNALPLYNFDIQGLSNVIEEDIINNIEKYTTNFDHILSASIYFKYIWLAGVSRYIEHNPLSVNLHELLSVINQIISEPDFWKENHDIPFNNYNWFLSRVLSIILLLPQKCDLKTDKEVFDEIKKILFTILSQDKTIIEDYSDLSHLSLNHVQGKLYEALCLCLLTTDDELESEIKDRIVELLDSKYNNPLLHFSLGKIFNRIYRKDAKWAIENINHIFPKENLSNWIASMEGYHLYTNRVYNDIFPQLKDNLHYDQFVKNIGLFGHSSSFFIITHIIIAFDESINGFNENDDLYKTLIESNNIVIYQDILNSLIRGVRNPKPEKIKIIWGDLWAFCKDADSEAKKHFLHESYRLLDYMKELNEEMEQWILSSSQYMDPFQARYFFEMLTPFVNTNPKIVGRIVLDFVIDKNVSMGSNLEKIVEGLYKSGFGENADKICNILAEKGNDELRIVYKKYHKG